MANNIIFYNWNRWYDPKIGRYLQADPIRILGGTNLYAYVGNAPINRWDAFGLREFSCAETDSIIREAGEQNLWQAFKNHSGGGIYDYKFHHENDTFNVYGNQLMADEFGNYLAGYAGYKAGGNWFDWIGYWGVRGGGVFYDLVDSYAAMVKRPMGSARFDFDADSIEQIKAGRERARNERKGIICECP